MTYCVAYVTADASCSSKHVDQPVGNHVDYWPCHPRIGQYLVRLHLSTSVELFGSVLDLLGEITGSVGVTVVAYVTAAIVHLKARGSTRRDSCGLLAVFVEFICCVTAVI